MVTGYLLPADAPTSLLEALAADPLSVLTPGPLWTGRHVEANVRGYEGSTLLEPHELRTLCREHGIEPVRVVED
jgi:hypothetical protein